MPRKAGGLLPNLTRMPNSGQGARLIARPKRKRLAEFHIGIKQKGATA